MTLHTVVDESSKKMTNGVTKSPSRREDFLLWRRFEYDFLVYKICALLPTFLFSFLFFFCPAYRYVYILDGFETKHVTG